MSYENNNTEKTSVKVSNPPGGKQSIRLGWFLNKFYHINDENENQ